MTSALATIVCIAYNLVSPDRTARRCGGGNTQCNQSPNSQTNYCAFDVYFCAHNSWHTWTLKTKLSDGSQPSMTIDSFLHEPTDSRSPNRLTRFS
jgi:hypothetical protein